MSGVSRHGARGGESVIVRFATVCDRCNKRSEEYSTFPSCRECLEDICPDCDIPSERSGDERNKTLCRKCSTEVKS